MAMIGTVAVGWSCVAIAWLGFGSFAVPIKSEAVRAAKVHPLVYQTYKTLWVFATSFLVLLWRPWRFSWFGVLSAAFW